MLKLAVPTILILHIYIAFHVNPFRFVKGGQNPDQSPYDNLDDAAATYAVGGMATHWTAATPREHPKIERSKLIVDHEWSELYQESEKLLKTNHLLFDRSIRNTVVREKLCEAYHKELKQEHVPEKYFPQNLPLAGVRKNVEFVTWTGADTILGVKLIKSIKSGDASKITLKVRQLNLIANIT